jgi:hypothetical protein
MIRTVLILLFAYVVADYTVTFLYPLAAIFLLVAYLLLRPQS